MIRRNRAVAAAAVTALLAVASTSPLAAAAPPSVYWHSNPTLPGETLLIAGAGFAQNATSAIQLCADAACGTPVAATVVDVWNHSVKVALPGGSGSGGGGGTGTCGPPCYARLSADSGESVTVPVNAPDVWWAAASPPLTSNASAIAGSAARVTVFLGRTLRVFGRGLAWDEAGTTCLDSRTRVVAVPSTVLTLRPGLTLSASAANCYEASFEFAAGEAVSGRGALAAAAAAVPVGPYPNATLTTPWGTVPLPITVSSLAPATPPAVFDVDASYGGDVAAALAAAHGPSARVVLGSHTYNLSQPLTIPDQTVLQGQGAGATTLVFRVPAAEAQAGPGRSRPLAAPRYGTPLITGGNDWELRNFSVLVQDAPAYTPVVWQQPGTHNLTCAGVNITMLQANVSNAIRVEGARFVLAWNTFVQAGQCLWPPTMDTSNFQYSTTLYLHAATDGWVHHNTVFWQCSLMDFDVSQFYVAEDNVAHCTQNGTIPHGNSISAYDWHTHPQSGFMSFSRNTLTRPTRNGAPDHQNWRQRETVTTDGSGGFGSATVTSVSADRRSVVVEWVDPITPPVPGSTMLVLAGPGMGQHRQVVGFDHATQTATLDAPVDDWVVPVHSLLAFVGRCGHSLINGNSFVWAEVVQFYGNTVVGVHADNNFQDCNVQAAGGDGGGALQGVGECYHGSGQSFFTEYVGNRLNRSDGILLKDNSQPTSEPECAHYHGPWVRWATLRRNSLDGISDAARAAAAAGPPATQPLCGQVSQVGTAALHSTDIVAEANAVACPAGGVLPGGVGTNLTACDHCVTHQG